MGHRGDTDPAVVVRPPDTQWPAVAADIMGHLRRACGSYVQRIEHIGSTAVPGMAAKNVIDIQASVANLDAATDALDEALQPLGFVRGPYEHDHLPAASDDDSTRWRKRFWTRRGAGSADVNLHVREVGAPNERYALLFRDWLRAHPDAVPAYSRFKKELATAVDRTTYTDIKDPVVDLIIVAAERWAEATGWRP